MTTTDLPVTQTKQGGCQCGHENEVLPELDARELPHAIRHGAILGALIMQSLQSGMAMVGVDAPFQNIVVGVVLVIAVLVDILYRKRTGEL